MPLTPSPASVVKPATPSSPPTPVPAPSGGSVPASHTEGEGGTGNRPTTSAAIASPEINEGDKSPDKPLGNTGEVKGSSGLHPNIPARPPQNLPGRNPLPQPNAEARFIPKTASQPATGGPATLSPKASHVDERPRMAVATSTGEQTQAERRVNVEENKKIEEVADQNQSIREELGQDPTQNVNISRRNSILQEQGQLLGMKHSRDGNTRRHTAIGPDGVETNVRLKSEDSQTRPAVDVPAGVTERAQT